MLTGFGIGLVAAFVWSLTNLIDKFLVEQYAHDGNVSSLLLLSCFFPTVLMATAFIMIGDRVLLIHFQEQILLIVSGFLMVGWIFFYLKALSEDEASVVMTLLVLAPFFSLLFAFFIIGELPTTLQILAGALMIAGSLIVVYAPKTHRLKWKVLVYALVASGIAGLMNSVFKFVTLEGDVWQSLFWRSFGMVLAGVIILMLFSRSRRSFFSFMSRYARVGTSLNVTNETLTLVGDTLFAIALLFAPLALVQTTEAYQPLFVFLMVLILSKLGFSYVSESLGSRDVVRKSIGFFCTLCGAILLVVSG